MKRYLGKWILSSAIMMFTLSATLPEPYASVKSLSSTPYFVQDGYVLYDLILNSGAAVIVDVESQDGGIARYIAQQKMSLPALQAIYSVNPWVSADHSQKQMFQRFLSNVIQENTTALITPIRMSAQEGAESLNIMADFISLVGKNDQNFIYKDILSWYPHLTDIGIMCGNNWSDSSVQIGVTKAAKALDVTLHINDQVWYFQKGM